MVTFVGAAILSAMCLMAVCLVTHALSRWNERVLRRLDDAFDSRLGSSREAIEWAAEYTADAREALRFLLDWQDSDVSAWPEYSAWLAERRNK